MNTEVLDAYTQLTKDFLKSHRDFKAKEKRNEKDKLIHGTIMEQKQIELDGGWDDIFLCVYAFIFYFIF